jgi:enamine deaminase RidA (YjgF/YER057c/UK114 family)
MTVAARLAELGLTLPSAATPVGAYVPAVRSGSLVFTSGQLPFVGGALPATGVVGTGEGQVAPEAAQGYAAAAALGAVAAVAALLADETGEEPAAALEHVVRVVKVVGFVGSDPQFTGQPGVINGASGLLQRLFGDAGVHARSAVGVAALPMGAPVEVEIVVETR